MMKRKNTFTDFIAAAEFLDSRVRPRSERRDLAGAVAATYRSDLNAARISDAKSSGCSHAAKCPPLSTSLKYARPG